MKPMTKVMRYLEQLKEMSLAFDVNPSNITVTESMRSDCLEFVTATEKALKGGKDCEPCNQPQWRKGAPCCWVACDDCDGHMEIVLRAVTVRVRRNGSIYHVEKTITTFTDWPLSIGLMMWNRNGQTSLVGFWNCEKAPREGQAHIDYNAFCEKIRPSFDYLMWGKDFNALSEK